MKKIISATLLVAGFLLGASALSVFATGTWSPAPSTPPDNNVDAPINVGSGEQTKKGPLILNFDNTFATGLKVLGGIQIVDGTQGEGKVLTSNASGTARWVLPSNSSSTASASNIALFNYTSGVDTLGRKYTSTNGYYNWVAPAGVTRATVEVLGAAGGSDTGDGGGGCGPGGCGRGAGGGGGYARSAVNVTPGTSYSIQVGKGGATSSYSANSPYCGTSVPYLTPVGSSGTDSSFNTLIIGRGGRGPTGGNTVVGLKRCGIGGSGGSGVGDVVVGGTTGEDGGQGTYGGAGGSAFIGNYYPFISAGGSSGIKPSMPGAASFGGSGASNGMNGQVIIMW